MNILLPIDVTNSMLVGATNLPRYLPTEVLWVASQPYTAADVANAVQRVWGDTIYTVVREHTSRAVPPPDDPMYWLPAGPTNRMSPFDMYRNTKAVAEAGNLYLIYEVYVGFFDGINLQEVNTERLKIEILDEPGGTVEVILDQEMWEQASGLWELLFGDLRRETTKSIKDLPMSPRGTVRVTLYSSNPDARPSLGYMSVGNWTSIIGRSRWGGTQYGVQLTPKSYSYRKVNNDGSVTQLNRGVSARNISGIVVLEADEAPAAVTLLERILNKAVAIEMSDLPKYSHLQTVGFVEGSVKSENWSMTTISITVEGLI